MPRGKFSCNALGNFTLRPKTHPQETSFFIDSAKSYEQRYYHYQ